MERTIDINLNLLENTCLLASLPKEISSPLYFFFIVVSLYLLASIAETFAAYFAGLITDKNTVSKVKTVENKIIKIIIVNDNFISVSISLFANILFKMIFPIEIPTISPTIIEGRETAKDSR